MRLINDHRRIRPQIRLNKKLPQQHSIGHIFDKSLRRGIILESHSIPDLFAQFDIHLLADPFGHTHSSYPARLSASDSALFGVTFLMEVLGELGGFAGAGLADHYDNLVLSNEGHEFLAEFENRQRLLD